MEQYFNGYGVIAAWCAGFAASFSLNAFVSALISVLTVIYLLVSISFKVHEFYKKFEAREREEEDE